MVFQYEDVSREVDKRTTGFEFPDVDGGYVQDNGHGSRRYPLRCYFSGASHDLQATAFELALLERGPGRLEHPFYGSFDAIAFGTITRRDDLKTAANQSIIDVVFWTTIGALYPSGLMSPRNELLVALDAFDFAIATEFEETMQLERAAARVATKANTRSLLRYVSDALEGIAAGAEAVNRDFREAQSAVNYGLDVLVGQPLLLAQQIGNLVTAPARALVGLEMRLEGYRQLAQRIFATTSLGAPFQSPALSRMQLSLTNGYRTADLFAMHAVAGSLRAVIETTFQSKPAALAAADTVLTQFDDVVAWRDRAAESLGIVDRGAAQQALQHATARAAGYLIEQSYALAAERRIVLDRPRTIIDLAAELYGSVDDKLDLLISTNELTGAEVLELPRGTSIAYYR